MILRMQNIARMIKKERALKNKNLKKSGESLRELYYKVDDEAYHIIKNRRRNENENKRRRKAKKRRRNEKKIK